MIHATEKILTWHPAGKRGVYIAGKDYLLLRDFILSVLQSEEISLTDLIRTAEEKLTQKIESGISWSILVVKLDLEARGVLTTISRRVPYPSQFLKLRPGALKKIKISRLWPNEA